MNTLLSLRLIERQLSMFNQCGKGHPLFGPCILIINHKEICKYS